MQACKYWSLPRELEAQSSGFTSVAKKLSTSCCSW